jgi:hypothetical protein
VCQDLLKLLDVVGLVRSHKVGHGHHLDSEAAAAAAGSSSSSSNFTSCSHVYQQVQGMLAQSAQQWGSPTVLLMQWKQTVITPIKHLQSVGVLLQPMSLPKAEPAAARPAQPAGQQAQAIGLCTLHSSFPQQPQRRYLWVLLVWLGLLRIEGVHLALHEHVGQHHVLEALHATHVARLVVVLERLAAAAAHAARVNAVVSGG